MSDHDDQPDGLDRRLRRDATAWSPARRSGAAARLQATLDSLPQRGTDARRPWAAAAAAAVLLGAGVGYWMSNQPTRPPAATLTLPTFDADPGKLEHQALAPLERELLALGDDAEMLASSLMQRMPRPLRRLVAH